MSVKGDQLIFKCPKCNKNHNKDFNNDLINRFVSTYEVVFIFSSLNMEKITGV